jgi:uncharacterized protein (TIRG00374 family)
MQAVYRRIRATFRTTTGSTASIIVRAGIGITVSVLAILLIVREVDLRAVGTALSRLSAGYLLLGLLSVTINTLAKTLRWRVLLGHAGRDVHFSRLLIALLTGQMLNALLPVRVGELSRSVDIGTRGAPGAGTSFVFGTIVLEKIIDVVCLAFVCVCVLLLIPLPGWIGQSMIPTAVAAMLSFAIVVALAVRVDWITQILMRFATRLPERWHIPVITRLMTGLDSLRVLKHTPDRFRIVLWSVVAWVSAVTTNYVVLLAFDVHVPMIAAGLLLVLLLVGVSIPALPGGIGLFEYLCIVGLGLFAVDSAVALTYGVVLHAIILLPMILVGPVYFLSTDAGATLSGLLHTITRK